MRILNLIVEWSLNNRIIVLILIPIFLIIGFNSVRNLKLDAIPDVTNVQVQIVTSAPSLSAWELEQYITYPVEWGIGGIPGIKTVRSISRYGISLVTVVFEEDYDLIRARQLVSERLIELQKSIPSKYGTPELAPLSTALGEIVQFTLESDKHSIRELTTTLQWYISPALKTIPGIVEINIFGGEIKQFQVHLNLKFMQKLGVSIEDVILAIQANNLSEGGGYIEKNQEHTIIGINSLLTDTKEFENIYIKSTMDGSPILLKSIASIEEGYELRKGAATKNGSSQVTGGIALMMIGENSLKTSQAVIEKIHELESSLPEGMKINVFYDRSEMVLSTIKTVMMNLSEGAILVIVILFLMLGDFKSGLIIAVVIPLCMIFAIIIMEIRNAPANLMSMGAIDFGLLVDGAVIVIENATRRLGLEQKKLGRPLNKEERQQTILDATIEVRRATIYGELIIGVVYIPILVLSGTEGKLFIPMAQTVLYALSGAFLFTLTIVPVLAFYFLDTNKSHEEETRLFKWIKIRYESILDYTLKIKHKVLSLALVVFIFSVILFKFIGAEFIPVLDEGSSLLEITRLPSTSLSESIRTTLKIERSLINNKFPEISSIVSKTGSPNLALEPMGIEKSDVFIQLIPRKEWTRSRDELLDAISLQIKEELPEVAFGLSQPIEMRTNEMVAGIRSDVGIKIFGKDLFVLKSKAEELANIVKNIKGVTDIRIEQLGGVSYLQVVPNREKMARFGVDSVELARITSMISSGLSIGQILDGARKFDIVLRIQDPPLTNIQDWQSLLVNSRSGKTVPLGDVADIIRKDGPAQISHDWQERRVLVEFNIRNRDVMSAVDEIQKLLTTKLQLQPGYRIEYDGTFQSYLSAMKSLYFIIPITLLLILFLLWMAVENLQTSLLLFLSIPLSVTGGIIALFIRGIPFSISAGIGFIALSGVAVLNSLVLVTFAKKLQDSGLSIQASIRESALVRIRPILMTSLVAILGFLPMALSTNPGAEVQRPLATVVIGGLISNILITLIVFPSLYTWANLKFLSLTGQSERQT
ncbi:efflux RND transporter permease subunit [Leptospira sp. GIMC2001]|uniref:efflux RND transporter permease subunit n=1 Tax=Leptospira sp. GIMC2001 TaxID=1513297 RepID=UPI0004A5C608|nr:CusA/CzcA family heavy metal efflux RND transporter [Leptospira sp. GIMC2001]AID56179.1 cobalt-zinc-cadmium resistance protein CzcA [Leptospira sp. GIMC2001]WCL50036.1 CusA/CzcA family heavy metal efflux RND transporter [Leptospira sp. GIMC2001]